MQKGKKGNQIVLALVITVVSLAIYKIVPRLFFGALYCRIGPDRKIGKTCIQQAESV